MALVHIRPRNNRDAGCLVRELSAYEPRRVGEVVLIELDGRSQADLLALLSAVEVCLGTNDIPSIRVEIEGKPYLMTPAAAD